MVSPKEVIGFVMENGVVRGLVSQFVEYMVRVEIDFIRAQRGPSEILVCIRVVKKSSIDLWRANMWIEDIQYYNIALAAYNP